MRSSWATDFTVMKIMLTAIVVGMIGVFSMHAPGFVQLHVKPTPYAANIIGGLIFGAGFALLGYCPGTGATAIGQGNYDAIVGIIGLLAGSYLYAEMSGYLDSTLLKWGTRGKIMLPDLMGGEACSFYYLFYSFVDPGSFRNSQVFVITGACGIDGKQRHPLILPSFGINFHKYGLPA